MIHDFPEKYKNIGVFGYVPVTLLWNLAYKHGFVRYRKLTGATAKLPSKKEH